MDQRRRRWADVVQMLYECFVFAGYMTLQDPEEKVIILQRDMCTLPLSSYYCHLTVN